MPPIDRLPPTVKLLTGTKTRTGIQAFLFQSCPPLHVPACKSAPTGPLECPWKCNWEPEVGFWPPPARVSTPKALNRTDYSPFLPTAARRKRYVPDSASPRIASYIGSTITVEVSRETLFVYWNDVPFVERNRASTPY